jgi:virulence-associated protein VagC
MVMFLTCSIEKRPMRTAEIIHSNGTQAVKLPEGFHFEGDTVSIRREGEAVILEPVKQATWPPGFFDRIRIDDPAFRRPPQGQVPRAPSLD